MEKTSVEDTGYILIRHAHGAWYVDDLETARDLLNQISDTYWEKHFPRHLQEDQMMREMVADLVEAFGVVDFRLLRKSGVEA